MGRIKHRHTASLRDPSGWSVLTRSLSIKLEVQKILFLSLFVALILPPDLAPAALNMAVFLLIGKTSALTMNVAGVVKDWLLILLSVLLYKWVHYHILSAPIQVDVLPYSQLQSQCQCQAWQHRKV